MGYGQPAGLIAVPPLPTPPLAPVLDIWALNRGDRVNVAGKIRTVDKVVLRPTAGTLVRWQEGNWTEAPGPYNSAHFLEAVGAHLEQAA
ncbi:hypothetical protein [Frigoribacterium sp. CG_9.8]|uniref:hypothetical protein n=1 Tax=Frigoribacterium sp. CG_9.8 TaxID=2787733 RepID=UPI0018CA6C52|nr:hypothetical protein [Frigoribacterium sp. CG_9.8]MBG6106602.1 hypothetical protein [Frigoribacterium sp. CG_9.8]